MIAPLAAALVAALAAAGGEGPSPAPAAVAPSPPAPQGAGSIGFDEAVRRALARNPSAVVAAEEVRRLEGLRLQAASGALPLLGATGALTRLDADRVAAGRVVAAEQQASASLALTVPIVAPSRWFQWSHGSAAVAAAEAGRLDTARAVAVAAGRAYLAVLAGRNLVKVAESARQTAQAHLDYSTARRAAGLGNAIEVLQAEQELAASEVQLQAASAGLVASREGLGLVTGSDGPLDAEEQPSLAVPAGPEAEVQRRADVRAAQARADVAIATDRDSWADWLPTLLGQAQYFFQDPPTLTTPKTGWQAQLVLSLPLFEGGLRAGQARERSALRQEAQAALDALLRQARAEVRTTWEALARARAGAEAARRGAASAKAALDLADTAYRAGAVNDLQVIDAQRRARDSALTAVVADQAERQALVDLLAATGNFP
jgi:outer membrane protein TolC